MKHTANTIKEQVPGVLPLLPLLYVAWADAVLSPSEKKLISAQIKKMHWLNPLERETAEKWSTPAQPPSIDLFENWVELIKESSENLDDISRQGLIDLSLKMAEAGGSRSENNWSTPEAKEALKAIESALGLTDLRLHRGLLSEKQRIKQQENLDRTPTFDVAAMTRLLDGEQAELRKRVKTLLSDPEFELVNIRDKDAYRNRVLKWCRFLAQQGFGSLHFPESTGGKNDMKQYATVFEMLGYHDISLTIKFGVQVGLFGGSIMWLGTQKHHDKYLKDAGNLSLLGCFAMTETGHGSNVRNCETTAIYDEATNEFVINTPTNIARKEYIGNALHGRMASVFAQLYTKGVCHGVHAFLVPLRNENGVVLPRIRVEDCGYKLGLNGVDNGQIWFDQVRIPRENLLDKFGTVAKDGTYSSNIESQSRRFFTMLGTLVGGRVCVPMAGLSAAKKGLTIAIRHALNRRQFGPENEPETLLLDYPSHQKRLLPLLANAYALDFAHKYLLKRFDEKTESDSREIETLAAALKSYSTWNTTKTLQECREACGGKGYLYENQLASLKADTEIFTTFEGDNTVLMQLVAKGLLTEMRREFSDANFWEIVKLLSKDVLGSIASFGHENLRDEDHICSADFQVDEFRHREKTILRSVASRLTKLIKKRGMAPTDAFNRVQNHMIDLAHAYAERIVMEQFSLGVEAVENPELRTVLEKMRNLYALSCFEAHKGWYLETGHMTPPKTKTIKRLHEKYCMSLRYDAAFLVDAFDIPNQCLAAPIALRKEL